MSFNESQIKQLKSEVDHILSNVTSPSDNKSVNGVVAGITNKNETIYLNSAGVKDLATKSPITNDSIFCYFSTTKAITTTAILKLYQDNLIDLDRPSKEYLPAIGEIQILDKVNDDGTIVTHTPKVDITMRMLLTHTAGFAYPFFNAEYQRLLEKTSRSNILNVTKDFFKSPLLFEPGSQWFYGINLDWAGLILQEITGMKLSEYIQKHIFDPIGMKSCTFHITSSKQLENLIKMHSRPTPEDTLVLQEQQLQYDPEYDMGGHGIFGNVDDYLKFIRVWLNGGKTENGVEILKPEVFQLGITNQLPSHIKGICSLPGVDKNLSNEAEFFPGEPKTWTFGFMRNETPAFTGRPKGSLAWAGLANLYYWIDIETGIGGYWATQVFPFVDFKDVSGFFEMETKVYDILKS